MPGFYTWNGEALYELNLHVVHLVAGVFACSCLVGRARGGGVGHSVIPGVKQEVDTLKAPPSYELHQVKTTWTCLSLQENANVFTVRPLQAYRCFGSGAITRHAKHIMTPPTTRMAPPIHPTKRAGPNVYLRRIQRAKQKVRRPELNVEVALVWHHLGVWAPISPATASPPTTPKPSSVYVTKRKLCTIRLAKADTPAMPHPPDCQERETMNVALVILRRVFSEERGTWEQEEDPGGQRQRGLQLVLHVTHFQALEGEQGHQAAGGSEDNADNHQGPDGLEQGWKSEQGVQKLREKAVQLWTNRSDCSVRPC